MIPFFLNSNARVIYRSIEPVPGFTPPEWSKRDVTSRQQAKVKLEFKTSRNSHSIELKLLRKMCIFSSRLPSHISIFLDIRAFLSHGYKGNWCVLTCGGSGRLLAFNFWKSQITVRRLTWQAHVVLVCTMHVHGMHMDFRKTRMDRVVISIIV